MGRVRISRGRLLAIGVLAVVVVGAVWYINRSEPIPTRPPAGAPHPGSCFAVTPDQAQQALPWPGGPVACTSAHTAEVYHVGQVDHDLISQARKAKGDPAKIAMNLMFGEVRRACGVFADDYLGGDWHKDQVTLLANWITPAANGFFGCALVQITGPGGSTYVTRNASVKGIGDTGPLATGCVTRTGDAVRFAACTEPHTGEFVGTYRITPDNAPFDAKGVADAANQGCARTALAYLGLPETASRADLHIGYVGPTTAATWLGSDQTFDCYASATSEIRGTIHNLGTGPLPT
jgi:putative regulator of septum formation